MHGANSTAVIVVRLTVGVGADDSASHIILLQLLLLPLSARRKRDYSQSDLCRCAVTKRSTETAASRDISAVAVQILVFTVFSMLMRR